VQTYEVGVEQGRHFLAMDYLDGQPLHHLLRKVTRARMPLDVHVRILADMLAGLHYAHTLTDFDGTPLHVVHRDISPQNVFVTYDGQVKLVDFGIAKAAGAVSNTQSGVFKGKLTYVAPEQAGGDVVDARADIFSVGVMLWEAMSGRRFAQGEGQTETFAKRLAGTEPRIRDVVPDADSELADICDCAMAHRKEDRFASARDFRDALETFLDRFSRRVGSREVSDLMNAAFAEERDRIRGVIDQQMKQIMRETAQALPVPTIEAHGAPLDHTPITTVEGLSRRRAPAEHHSGFPGAVETSGSGTLVGVEQRPSVLPRSRTVALLLAGLAMLALLSVGTLIVVATRSDGSASTPATSAPRADTAAPPSDKVQLTITFGPSSATAKLDGVPLLSSPFTAQVPRDGSMHRVDVEGPGLASKTMMVAFDKDVKLDIVLEPASTTASASAAPATPATQPQPGPGRPGKPPGKQPLGIDEDDPYKKR
jgi:serine/threonine-protein kinase